MRNVIVFSLRHTRVDDACSLVRYLSNVVLVFLVLLSLQVFDLLSCFRARILETLNTVWSGTCRVSLVCSLQLLMTQKRCLHCFAFWTILAASRSASNRVLIPWELEAAYSLQSSQMFWNTQNARAYHDVFWMEVSWKTCPRLVRGQDVSWSEHWKQYAADVSGSKCDHADPFLTF